MSIRRQTYLYIAMMALSLAGSVYADDDLAEEKWDMGNRGASSMSLVKKNWEFGLMTGVAYGVGNKTTSIDADNSAFLKSDPGSPGEDEFTENQLVPPDFTGTTKLVGETKKSYIVGAHLYYKLTDWIATGIEGSYEIEDEVNITLGGPFTSPIYTSHFRTHGAQAVLAVRLGGWIYGIRPYVMGGVGPYMRSMSVTAELSEPTNAALGTPDDPDHPPIEAGSRTDTYASSLIGAGIDFRVTSSGSIGLGIQYQRVYSPGNAIAYVIPQARFDYHF